MRILVSGTSGVLGAAIARDLTAGGAAVTASSRRPGPGDLRLDLTDEAAVRRAAKGHDAAILCPILTTSAPAAGWLSEEGVGRIVVFSSNNVGIDFDSPVYAALRKAEGRIQDVPAAVSILRPTMIYGYPGDGNLSKLVAFARRFGFLPCPGDGEAQQQPIFVDDLARAVAATLDSTVSPGLFSVAGAQAVTTKALFTAALGAAGRSQRAILPIPLAPLRLAAAVGERAGLKLPLGTAQLRRMTQDKTPTEPAPPGFAPQISLEEGLSRLAAELADSPHRR